MSESVQADPQMTPSRKRSRVLYEKIMKVVSNIVVKKPELLPKRQPSEDQLMAHYKADRLKSQQAPQASSAFQYRPHKKAASTPSIFSPTTSKAYASPGSVATAASPYKQPEPLPIQRQGLMAKTHIHSPLTTPLRSR